MGFKKSQSVSLLKPKNLLQLLPKSRGWDFKCQVVIGHTNVPADKGNILIGRTKLPIAIPIGHGRVPAGHTNISNRHSSWTHQSFN